MMHDGMPYDPIQGQGHETFKVRNSSIFKIYLLRHFNVSWQMTTDSETTEQYLTFVWSRFLISVLVIGITADNNHIIFPSPATRLTYSVATVILQNKPRFLGEKPETQTRPNKNLAIANRSRVSCINTNNNTMTLKSGLEVTQGH